METVTVGGMGPHARTATLRGFRGEEDLPAMAALAARSAADNLHVVDLPYRFSSWALDDPANAGLWDDTEGQLLGWAVMQTPFWTVDCACDPSAGNGLFRETLAWADSRAQALLNSPYGRPRWYVNVFAGQDQSVKDLEKAGFTCQSDVPQDPWEKVFMHRPPSAVPPSGPSAVLGFAIRPITGESEVEAYVGAHRAVFETRSMTTGWRRRTMRRPEYVPGLDLVAVSPDGEIAAFCVCWLGAAPGLRATGQIEPLGVLPAFRGAGLGRAILGEGLRRLYLHGAGTVTVETDNYRNAAYSLYESAGFRIARKVLVFRKNYAR